MNYEDSEVYAKRMDDEDPLKHCREWFCYPIGKTYFLGNSLGLPPKQVRDALGQVVDDWSTYGVESFFERDKGRTPWMELLDQLTPMLAEIVGAKSESEVVLMNSLTTNLHLLMISFYQPNASRNKILVEHHAFPSDQYVVASQAHLHDLDPDEVILEVKPREGEETLRTEDFLQTIEEVGESVALVLLGGVHYYTGQVLDMKTITHAAHAKGCLVGFDLAHAVGNIPLRLHDWGVDFAVFCTYKYLNSGPGGIGGGFIHERHLTTPSLKRLEGWWGNKKATRFLMEPHFDPESGAKAWQLSTSPVLLLAAMKVSLEIFAKVGMDKLRKKSLLLTGYLLFLLKKLGENKVRVITPDDPNQRGAQLSIQTSFDAKELNQKLLKAGFIVDFREPDVLRVAPTPLYNTFSEIYAFVEILTDFLGFEGENKEET